MMDPDGIQITRSNLPNVIKVDKVPEFDFDCYDLNDEKDYNKYIKDIEKDIRHSFEYKTFIQFLRNEMGMNRCAYLKGVSNEESYDIKIEIHHYPFTLRDVVEIVYRKRCYYNEDINIFSVAQEATELHYKLLVGLVPLSITVHQLYHNGKIFIPCDIVLGRYNLFVDYYKPFCEPEQLETLERIEKYTNERSDILDTTIIDRNTVTYNVTNPEYVLPDTKKISNVMIEQINNIKDNNYMLPDYSKPQSQIPKKKTISPIAFFD